MEINGLGMASVGVNGMKNDRVLHFVMLGLGSMSAFCGKLKICVFLHGFFFFLPNLEFLFTKYTAGSEFCVFLRLEILEFCGFCGFLE